MVKPSQRADLRRLALIARACLGAILMLALAVPARADVSVGGDSGRQSIVGSGGILLNSTYSGPTGSRRAVAECQGCRWRLMPACEAVAGTLQCGDALADCPPGEQRFRVWHRPGPVGWQRLGTVCVGERKPVPMAQVRSSVEGSFERRVPALRPRFQPQPNALTGLPVIFRTEQPSRLAFDDSVAGMGVHVDARATWIWTLAPQTRRTVSVPGAPWPSTTISHVYAAPGRRTVALVGTWSGSFWVDGVGPLQMSSPVVQRTTFVVPVREARAVLVP